MSTTSDHPITVNGHEEVPVLLPPPPPPAAAKSGGRNKRGSRKTAVVHDIPIDPSGDGKSANLSVHSNRSRDASRPTCTSKTF